MMTLALLLAAATTLTPPDTATRFLDACAAGSLEEIRALLDTDPLLSAARRPDGASAVSLALFAKKKEEESFPDPATNAALQAILSRKPKLDVFDTAAVGSEKDLAEALGIDPTALTRRNRFGWTLVHLAAFGGNTATLKLLIDKGADVNPRAETRFRNTPLQTALLSGQYQTAKLLLDHGADALVRQSKGFTPMHEAAQLGRQDIVQLLLDHGAELNSRADDGRTPLAQALKSKRDELAAFLRSKGASVEPVPLEEPKK